MNQDYLLDDNGDLLIQNGDFVVGFSDNQHIEDVLQSFQGEWKQFPITGAGILRATKTGRPQDEINNAKSQLQAAGYQLDIMKIFIDEMNALRVQFPNGITNNG